MAVRQPADRTIQAGGCTTRLVWNPSFGSQKTAAFTQAQKFVDSEILRYMDPLSPYKNGDMIKSATQGTVIGSGHIVYNSVYARRQYYEHKSRSKWFEKVKAQKLDTIARGVGKIVGNH